MGRLDVPMVIVTAVADDGERSGCLVGFSTQTSIDPSRYGVCLSNKNHTHGVAARAGVLGVHLPTPDDFALAELFGSETGDEIDKFAEVEWTPGPEGVPLLDAVPNRFAGRVLARHDVGDHTLHVLEPIESSVSVTDGWRQLGFQQAKPMEPGHEA
jgi:flavin reductase (DIM6/NTAB) family NADH-FMN oxidoreductase RutF